ncbi:MAG: hypothetical protein RXR08_12760 [Sulfolobaceae archaeon]
MTKTWFNANFELEMRSLLVKGSIQPSNIAAKVELKEKPKIKSSGIKLTSTSTLYSSLEKPKMIPSSRPS